MIRKWQLDTSSLPKIIDPRSYQPELPVPLGFDRNKILSYLQKICIDGSVDEELKNYANEDCDRFIYTLDLVPDRTLEVLEIGANPYFTTFLLLQFRPRAHLHLINYFGGDLHNSSQKLIAVGLDGISTKTYTLDYLNANLEQHNLPLPDESLDVVLYCEVIEHLLNDPVQSLLEIKRVLKPNGLLIITTPNVARLENVARLIAGANVYDPYSGHGPYGRHNREYTRHELHHLLDFCGFSPDVFFTADVHGNRAADFCDLSTLKSQIKFRSTDLGQYLFCRYKNDKPASKRKPGWLYRSYPSSQLDMSSI